MAVTPANALFDFIIVGGGIAGASLAYELSKSASVRLLEREQAYGYHASGRSAATYIELLHHPMIVQLSQASLTFLQQPDPDFCAHPLLQPCPCLIIANAQEHAALRRAYDQALAAGTYVRWLEADALKQLLPYLNDQARYGLLEVNAQRIDVDALLQGYLKGARRQSAQTCTSAELTHLQWRKDHWHLSLNKGETLGAKVLINAAGAWGDTIAEMAGLPPIGLTPKRRTLIQFDPPQGAQLDQWPILGDVSGSFYLLADAGKLLASPADATPSPPCDASPDELDVATAAYQVEQHLDLQVTRIQHRWAGLRTFSEDGLPLLGYDPLHPHFFWLAAQGGFGVQTAPALAKMATQLLMNPQVAVADTKLKAFLPDRFRS